MAKSLETVPEQNRFFLGAQTCFGHWPDLGWFTTLEHMRFSNYLVYAPSLNSNVEIYTINKRYVHKGSFTRRFGYVRYTRMRIIDKKVIYPKVCIYYDATAKGEKDYQEGKEMSVHILAMRAFVGPPQVDINGKQWIVRHLNDDPLDYSMGNLKYGTHTENRNDYYKNKGKVTPLTTRPTLSNLLNGECNYES